MEARGSHRRLDERCEHRNGTSPAWPPSSVDAPTKASLRPRPSCTICTIQCSSDSRSRTTRRCAATAAEALRRCRRRPRALRPRRPRAPTSSPLTCARASPPHSSAPLATALGHRGRRLRRLRRRRRRRRRRRLRRVRDQPPAPTPCSADGTAAPRGRRPCCRGGGARARARRVRLRAAAARAAASRHEAAAQRRVGAPPPPPRRTDGARRRHHRRSPERWHRRHRVVVSGAPEFEHPVHSVGDAARTRARNRSICRRPSRPSAARRELSDDCVRFARGAGPHEHYASRRRDRGLSDRRGAPTWRACKAAAWRAADASRGANAARRRDAARRGGGAVPDGRRASAAHKPCDAPAAGGVVRARAWTVAWRGIRRTDRPRARARACHVRAGAGLAARARVAAARRRRGALEARVAPRRRTRERVAFFQRAPTRTAVARAAPAPSARCAVRGAVSK